MKIFLWINIKRLKTWSIQHLKQRTVEVMVVQVRIFVDRKDMRWGWREAGHGLMPLLVCNTRSCQLHLVNMTLNRFIPPASLGQFFENPRSSSEPIDTQTAVMKAVRLQSIL